MKIITWNINGIRSLKSELNNILKELDGDIVCFQETKISRNQLEEDTALIEGYNSYFSFCRKQSGYSGVATYCRDTCTPEKAQEGLSGILIPDDKNSCVGSYQDFNELMPINLQALDSEGRTVITQHEVWNEDKMQKEKLVVINVYCPCVDPEKPERKKFKLQFCQLMEAKAKSLSQEGYHVVVVGDINIAHRPIDHCDPCDEKLFYANEARQWFASFLEMPKDDGVSVSFVDTYRYFHAEEKEAYTCWNTVTGARLTNYGTRIDYILATNKLLPMFTDCKILSHINGSDHCPVSANLKCYPMSAINIPTMCSRLWPEYTGKQQKLHNFLKKPDASIPLKPISESLLKRKPKVAKTQNVKRNKISSSVDKQKPITNFFKNSCASQFKNSFKKSCTELIEQKSNAHCSSDSDLCDVTFSMEGNESQLSQERNMLIAEGTNPFEIEDNVETDMLKLKQAAIWKTVLSGPPAPPLCIGHNKACVLRTVRKEGPNFGRQFFACSLPNGHPSNPQARCNYFQWVTPVKCKIQKVPDI